MSVMFEWTGSASTLIKYFYAGTQRVATKKGSTVYYIFGDHLGSTAITTNRSGAKVGDFVICRGGRIDIPMEPGGKH